MNTVNAKSEENSPLLKNDNQVLHSRKKIWLNHRTWMAILHLFGFALVNSQRIDLSMTIISMVNHTALRSSEEIDPLHNESESPSYIVPITEGDYIWNKEMQGHILGAFFYGYFVSQVPSGWLAEQYGCKLIYIISVGISTIATIFTPLACDIGGYYLLIFVRVMTGLSAGAVVPCFVNFWSKWAPPDERSRLVNITISGASIGTVLTMCTSGALCSTLGWRSVFYLSGGCTLIWLIIWYIVASDHPSESKYISNEEKMYIISSTKDDNSRKKSHLNTPWISILTSPTVLGLITVMVCFDWGFYTFQTNIPTYMYEVLGFDMTSNGLFSSLPFIGSAIITFIAPVIADGLISKKIFSIRNTRVTMTCIGCIGAASFIIGLSFASQQILAVILLTSGVSISQFVFSGFFITPMEIAPNFAATIVGLGNGAGAITGFISPYVTAVLTKNHTIEEWQHVFFLTAGTYTFGFIVFAIFCKGHILAWAKHSVNDDLEYDNI